VVGILGVLIIMYHGRHLYCLGSRAGHEKSLIQTAHLNYGNSRAAWKHAILFAAHHHSQEGNVIFLRSHRRMLEYRQSTFVQRSFPPLMNRLTCRPPLEELDIDTTEKHFLAPPT
jgi:hypothetical protein